ncbi:hypothetical protein [Methylomarinum vadi]|uniref:hypothetical protein n=1 Tax=Methylomarinum vadi TaxID=438855 RepID=UPI0004DF6DE3|nr:hypothetical protein [Methylomarinum vadi]
MSADRSLPFYLNIESLSAWLESISALPPVNAGSQLNQAINQLRKAGCEHTLVFPLLMKLMPTTLHLANALAALLKPGPQKNKTAKIAKLSLQLLRNLALAFHSLLESEHLSIPQKLQAVYFALQLTGQYLRLSNLFHELPSETLWNKSGELFTFAQNNTGLQEDIANKISEFRHQSSIEQVIKRNLLFTLTAFHQQVPTDHQALFAFANEYSDLLKFAQEKSGTCRYIWNYRKGVPYQITQTNRPLYRTEIALDVSALLPPLQSSAIAVKISKQERERLYQLLTGYEKLINETLPSAPIVLTLFSGFKPVYDFLNKLEKLKRIQELSAKIPEQKKQSSFSLEPLEHEKSLMSSFGQVQKQAALQGTPVDGQNVKLLQSKNKNYLHIESKNPTWQIGDLVLLVNKKNAYMAGKILQTQALSNTQSTMVLIEKFTGNLSTQAMQSDQYSHSTAILINQESETPEILLPYDKYRNGAEVQLGSKKARLDSLLDYSPFFAHYRMSY